MMVIFRNHFLPQDTHMHRRTQGDFLEMMAIFRTLNVVVAFGYVQLSKFIDKYIVNVYKSSCINDASVKLQKSVLITPRRIFFFIFGNFILYLMDIFTLSIVSHIYLNIKFHCKKYIFPFLMVTVID